MDALKIALETMIVGALALPAMFLLVDLFCPEKEHLFKQLLELLDRKAVATVAGALAVSLAYVVGASVGRVATDFFNDDDLQIDVTEDAIRTSVYCDSSNPWLIQTGAKLTIDNQQRTGTATPCTTIANSTATAAVNECRADREACDNRVRQTFAVQEASLLVTGAGNTDRLRYLHQQLVVLRGVALDGVVVTLLCLFGFCAQNRTWGRAALFVIAGTQLAWSVYALRSHLYDHWHNIAGEPPVMEIVLIAIGVAGLVLTLREVPPRPYRCAFMFSAVLTLLAYAGWWYSEVVYNNTVIFFFYAYAHPVGTMIQ